MKRNLLGLLCCIFCVILFFDVSAQDNTFNIGFDKYKTITSYNFPEAIVSSYSATRVAYTAEEMGKIPKELIQMKLPYFPADMDTGYGDGLHYYGDGKPFDIWDTLYGELGKVPLDIAIYIRNSTVFPVPVAQDSVDTSATNGWVKVWDGYYDFEQNEIVNVKIEGKNHYYPALVINFIEPFIYTGGVLEVVFINKSGNAPIIVERYDFKGNIKGINKDYFYCMYPFLCYYTENIIGVSWAGKGIINPHYYFDYFNGISGLYFGLLDDIYSNTGLFALFYRPMVEFTYKNDTSSIENYNNNLELDFTPNPVTNKINISFNTLGANTHIELLDISGSSLGIIYEGILEIGSHTVSYDLSKHNLSNGTYFIKLVQDKSVQVKPFIIAK